MLEKRDQGERKIDLSPCHICFRKPTEKKQLDGFADCQGCGGRMCYICMRECLGSKEMEEDGDVDGVDVEGGYNVLSCSQGKGEGYERERKDSGYGEGDLGLRQLVSFLLGLVGLWASTNVSYRQRRRRIAYMESCKR